MQCVYVDVCIVDECVVRRIHYDDGMNVLDVYRIAHVRVDMNDVIVDHILAWMRQAAHTVELTLTRCAHACVIEFEYFSVYGVFIVDVIDHAVYYQHLTTATYTRV